jgi:YD repeat-containing protein
MTRTRLAHALCGLAFLATSSVSFAIEPHNEYRKRVEASQNLSTLKDDLFGENVSLYNGQTSFEATDIDLPGNNALPVQLRRRLTIELRATDNFSALAGASNWDIEVPYMSGTFATNASDWSSTRCSGSIVPSGTMGFDLFEIWQGVSISIPGAGSRAVLQLQADTPRPNDGVARKWTTASRDAIDCIPMARGLPGEGFRVKTTQGITYHFNIGVLKRAGTMVQRVSSDSFAFSVDRTKAYLLASRVEDRFGNWVTYDYNANGNPTRIASSDGRLITLNYAGYVLETAVAAGRTWRYRYDNPYGFLASVERPDQSRWQYSYSNSLELPQVYSDRVQNSTCTVRLGFASASFDLTITHPSNAVGKFSFINQRHGRSGIHASECMSRWVDNGQGGTYIYYLAKPNFFDVMTVQSKTITGPGVPAMTWSYSLGSAPQGLWGSKTVKATYPCTTCTSEKVSSVTNPDGTKLEYRYGFLYGLNEGRLLGTTLFDSSGAVKRVDASRYMTTSEAVAQWTNPIYGRALGGEDPSTAEVRPVVQTTTTQDGMQFMWAVDSCGGKYCLDALARPTSVTRKSQPAP